MTFFYKTGGKTLAFIACILCAAIALAAGCGAGFLLSEDVYTRSERAVYDEQISGSLYNEGSDIIYDAAATRQAMLGTLQQRLQPAETVTFGADPDHYDVVIENADRNHMVRELKRRFEPVDLRGWRNVFHS